MSLFAFMNFLFTSYKARLYLLYAIYILVKGILVLFCSMSSALCMNANERQLDP